MKENKRNWCLFFEKSGLILFWMFLFFIESWVFKNVNEQILEVSISIFVLVGLLYSLVSFVNFMQYIFISYYIKIRYKEKYIFNCFTLLYIITFILLILFLHNGLKLLNIQDIVKFITAYNNSKRQMSIELEVAIILDLMLAIFFWAFYFYFCLKTIKKLIKTIPIMLFEKTLRSVLIAFTTWLLIATNIGSNITEINKTFIVLYIIIGSITTLAYPIFDMFEFTYQQIVEYEKSKSIEKN